ncbi:MAG: hypothetical protein ABSG43_06680, partial [Solirubrobacteraceae bacterium]
MRILAGDLSADEGEVAVGGMVAYMPQDVGLGDDTRTVRELLLGLSPRALRLADEQVLACEAQLVGGDGAAGMKLGAAIADWSALGGYELEGRWDVASRRIIRRPFAEVGEQSAVRLSGGERKQLVLEVLLASGHVSRCWSSSSRDTTCSSSTNRPTTSTSTPRRRWKGPS